ncbi:dihydropyrimidine dehydrogenase(NAD+) [Monocercomonoides exilis]|uniref:dihydropyrimidine dehydrogenase(NAD+) n=1 Tax=Monocercomonoides exilis TaxID=2049356 RepID=UPI00355A0538|nr:dihydropyrimidine dehydrogenase(NAD+) [Monocercomonoides exilis]|eukprot:MONOS_6566.1-p1 / transcript=MONOS_6566.1 / gene=MONOS_6566 / organism=Monocercomonoides_exilis_PA203 / gene_product=dihydropyrimidine dehydrogenase (NAD+) [EC:1.3.1.1] / transcript_product=dihydropyrimidine dehydrogenase (NAD+) [EC:1.3.1.1] / location=Mono_scaffold00208:84089-87248(+) / protein_length=1032 / sequence_SO=supercontig / SO=protein_coding / is_pseudo=false
MSKTDISGAVPQTVKRPMCFRPTSCKSQVECYLHRGIASSATELNKDFKCVKRRFTVNEAIREAQRCLKCVDSPCQASCPTQLDIRTFNHAISEGNFYLAAKILFTHNPLAWTCGLLCPNFDGCRGSCSLTDTAIGPLDIGELHCVACEAFMRMNLPQIRDPSIISQPYHKAKIALIGAGPASLSCATYLARLGYTEITIFEKTESPGGTPLNEIPEFRIPSYVTKFEVKLLQDLGVNFKFGKVFGKDITVHSLKSEGFDVIFIGIGLPEAQMMNPFTTHLDACNLWNSKTFLGAVATASKPDLAKKTALDLPNLKGHVVVCGAGDVAADCCQAAYRCGADAVSIVFRRGTVDMRMNPDEIDRLRSAKVEFVPCCSPVDIIMDESGQKASGLVCEVMRKIPGTEKYEKDNDQKRIIFCDHLISAFGSTLGMVPDSSFEKMLKGGRIEINPETGETSVEGVFAGGDCVGSGTIVAAVNDGKIAAWGIHRRLAQLISDISVPIQPTEVPSFMTQVDLVDTSVDVGGLQLLNPFGIAAGPSTECAPMIKRAFKAGFGFAITKTILAEGDEEGEVERGEGSGNRWRVENRTPRIAGDVDSETYMNIELESERTIKYWETEIPKIKAEYPKHILIASIRSKGSVASWISLAQRMEAAGVDALQLNIHPSSSPSLRGKPLPSLIMDILNALHYAVSIPLFPKIGCGAVGGGGAESPIMPLAKACIYGSADGIAAVHSMAAMPPLFADGEPLLNVGGSTTFASLTGRGMRPFALASIATIASQFPFAQIIASGGAENSLSAWQFIQCGARAVSFSSAIFSRGFSLLISELLPGLRWLLYARGDSEMRLWKSFVPPALFDEERKFCSRRTFGPFAKEMKKTEIEAVLAAPLPVEYPEYDKYLQSSKVKDQYEETASSSNSASASASSSSSSSSALSTSSIPSVRESLPSTSSSVDGVVSSCLASLVPYSSLSPAIKVISTIDTDMCLGCGRCQVACFDAGYACIVFDKTTRLPKVTPMCHGCGLCASVCPAKCIQMKAK